MSTEDQRQPAVGFENVAPGELARVKAAIEGCKGRFERGEVSPAEVNRVFAGVGAAASRVFFDELSAADIAAAEAGGIVKMMDAEIARREVLRERLASIETALGAGAPTGIGYHEGTGGRGGFGKSEPRPDNNP